MSFGRCLKWSAWKIWTRCVSGEACGARTMRPSQAMDHDIFAAGQGGPCGFLLEIGKLKGWKRKIRGWLRLIACSISGWLLEGYCKVIYPLKITRNWDAIGKTNAMSGSTNWNLDSSQQQIGRHARDFTNRKVTKKPTINGDIVQAISLECLTSQPNLQTWSSHPYRPTDQAVVSQTK